MQCVGIVDEAAPGANTYFTVPTGLHNLLPNGGPEAWFSATVPYNWTLSNCTTARVTTSIRSEPSAIEVTNTADNGYIAAPLPDSVIGKTITFAGWFKASSSNTDLTFFEILTNAHVSSQILIPPDDLWHYLSVTYAFPGGDTTPQAVIQSEKNGNVYYANAMTVCFGSSPLHPKPASYGYTMEVAGAYGGGSITAWNNATPYATSSYVDTVELIGVELGDQVVASLGMDTDGLLVSAAVTAADTVKVTFLNISAGAIDPSGLVIYLKVFKRR